MPLVTIHLREGKALEHRRAIADSVHQAMMDALKIPSDDRFQLIVEHSPENMIHDRVFLGIERSDASVFVQIVINQRDPSQKLKMYEHIVDNLAESPGIRKEDVFIGVVEVARENWWAYARHINESGLDTRATEPDNPTP
jgi:4-oxalocrotonate tautomerase